MKTIPSIDLPIVEKDTQIKKNLIDLFKNKKNIIFGVPGAFTPTCSEKHLPGYIDLCDQILAKGIEEIYCLSVNDPYVIKAWFNSFHELKKIKGIADGNADFSKSLGLTVDKSVNFMSIRSERFAMIVKNCDGKLIRFLLKNLENLKYVLQITFYQYYNFNIY